MQTSEQPAHAPQTAGQGYGMDKATARKLKKRELDRKAQRKARERTKNRIAHLEAMVGHLQESEDGNATPSLAAQLSQVTEQRDALLGALRVIESTIHRHLRHTSPTSTTTNQPRSDTAPDDDASSILPDKGKPQILPVETSSRCSSEDHLSQFVPPLPQVLPPNPWLVTNNTLVQSSSNGLQLNTNHQSEHPLCRQVSCPASNPRLFTQAGEEDVIVPQPAQPCECQVDSPDKRLNRNTWRAANNALGKPARLSSHQLMAEDYTSQDTPVRVVLEGWDSVERAGKTSSSWRKLRRVDEVCFSKCRKVERLAILRIMHLLLTYHGDPTPERAALLPRWLWTRPSQAVAHSYAIDFFVWPGIRERFIFFQHHYCTNIFWELFETGLKILWPHDLSDCFSQDLETGQYQFSARFEDRIKDVNCWTMSPDFFARFPELYGDIPVFQGLPPTPFTIHNDDQPQPEDIAQEGGAEGDGEDKNLIDHTGPAMAMADDLLIGGFRYVPDEEVFDVF